MRTKSFILSAVAVACVVGAGSLRAEERSLVLLFGPDDAVPARAAAKAAALAAQHWLQTPGSVVQLRSADALDAIAITGKANAKDMERAFIDHALKGGEADFASFLTSLDSSVQSLAQRPGLRLLVLVIKSPPMSNEHENTLEQLVGYCREHVIRVIVLDAASDRPKTGARPAAGLEALGRRTGGGYLTEARGLESSILLAAPVEQAGANKTEAEPAKTADKPAPAAVAAGSGQFTLPVRARFIRTSSRGATGSSVNLNVGGSSGAQSTGLQMSEAAGNANDPSGPMNGMFFVESPINALKFEVDDHAGTYQARARITQTVRNSKGSVVWRAQKEVTLRGPLKRMDLRQKGNLYLLRGVTLPGGDTYSLEGMVEDLIAGSAGSVQEPLKTGSTVPGLVVSDAVFVRPFKGSSDRFEADQILSYEGEALAPILDPVFRVEEPINLRLYLIIYPDRQGSQPELNMELLRDGKSVARLPLAFTTKINETALEGRHTSMSGSQAHEFPYLATIKGAKLGVGEFEARVSIRQGRNVLTRSVPFRVVGDAAPAVAAAGGPAGGTGSAIDENADVVLPELDPVEVTRDMTPSAEEQQRIWTEAATTAMGYSEHLPNFRCTQETHRLKAPVKTPGLMKETDSFKDELTYEDGKESYRTLEVNGAKSSVSVREEKGVHSRGEFGTMLSGLFSPEVAASYKWAGHAMAGGSLCQVFDITVERPKSNFALYFNKRREAAAYSGRVFIEEETGLVRKLIIEGSGLPPLFGLQSPSFSLDYGMVKVGTQDYLLPLRSVLQVRQDKFLVRNEAVFREYRKFEASSEMKF